MTAARFYGIRMKEGLGGVPAAIHSEVASARSLIQYPCDAIPKGELGFTLAPSDSPSLRRLRREHRTVIGFPSTAADVKYVDAEGRYTISHPSDWTEHFDEKGIPVLFAAPAEPGDEFGDHVAIQSESLPPGVTLDQYVKRGLREVVGRFGAEVRSHEATKLSGRQAFVDHLSFESDQGAWETLQWTVDADGEVFIITFTGEPGDRFDIWRPAAEGIARSFEVT